MKPDDQNPNFPAGDRAALREELLRHEGDDRLHVFDALNRQADDDGEEVPEMPDGLRDKLLEQFGSGEEPSRVPQAAAAVAAETAPPAFIERIVAFFQQKSFAAYGGLAAAACAVLLIAVVQLQRGGDGDDGKISSTRGDVKAPAVTAEVPVFLFPEAGAGAVVALMSGREVVVCADADDFAEKMKVSGAGWAVAADLERRVVLSFKDGTAAGEVPVDGDRADDVLLGIRAALDEMVKSP